jgi:DoxX-like family
MKKIKVLYWTTTVLAMGTGASSGYMYFSSPFMIGVFKHLELPDYFRIELGLLKVLGSLSILIPVIPARIKEWAYFGFGITFLSGTIAHMAIDGISKSFFPLIPFFFLVLSYHYYHRIKSYSSANQNIL